MNSLFGSIEMELNEKKEVLEGVFMKKKKSSFEDVELMMNIKKQSFNGLFTKKRHSSANECLQ